MINNYELIKNYSWKASQKVKKVREYDLWIALIIFIFALLWTGLSNIL